MTHTQPQPKPSSTTRKQEKRSKNAAETNDKMMKKQHKIDTRRGTTRHRGNNTIWKRNSAIRKQATRQHLQREHKRKITITQSMHELVIRTTTPQTNGSTPLAQHKTNKNMTTTETPTNKIKHHNPTQDTPKTATKTTTTTQRQPLHKQMKQP